ncbi:hypothetical protein AL066_13075 [Pseudomonas nunensis]|nr:hypothetical protein AL066_13075 [Pseudomonas nunensis]
MHRMQRLYDFFAAERGQAPSPHKPAPTEDKSRYILPQKAKRRFYQRQKRQRHEPQRDQCMNSAIKMMIGIGTPRKNRSSERMMILPG